jgi:hypothetical protein
MAKSKKPQIKSKLDSLEGYPPELPVLVGPANELDGSAGVVGEAGLWDEEMGPAYYNIVTQIGYVEDSHPSMVWWSHLGPKNKTSEALLGGLRKLLIDFFAGEFKDSECCKDKEPTKKKKFCQVCGGRLGWSDSLYGEKHQRMVEHLISDIHTGTYDSIAGNAVKYLRPTEYLEQHGWTFGRGMTSGPVTVIDSFDRYLLSDECWGDLGEGFCGDICQMKATFELV